MTAFPALDGYGANAATSGNQIGGSVSLTTSNTNDVVVLCVYNEAQGHTGPVAIANVTTTGLNWTKRSQANNTTANGSSTLLFYVVCKHYSGLYCYCSSR